eukprot:CAMPEP_0177502974 /NCGR_PEP_ID=MMETSP0369-20130122/38063_1 /TAXON_ID=447022 ORGANISM="Scrippsiella hangoei-like, Strain SHHI-4" /NCGR_SAMPLE_ID=MMETSP0369 /ASSEMBLY_ACC=CAM_ASM_000364 /LENGTH=39 /DNA_ID= /DNA_START= /DNA_END= /DNA_ORIENTATION=
MALLPSTSLKDMPKDAFAKRRAGRATSGAKVQRGWHKHS